MTRPGEQKLVHLFKPGMFGKFPLGVDSTNASGIAYFDARWPEPGHKKLTAYALYDKSISSQ